MTKKLNHTSTPKPHQHAENKEASLRLVAWETTRNCNLSCKHCRASATKGPYTGELDTQASIRLLDQIATLGKPIVILTGGEPLLRPDIFELASYGTNKGLRMVMAPNGTLITKSNAKLMADSGIKRVSISIDGATKESHDSFRGVSGAFEGALNGIELIKEAGVEFQINTTITKTNLDQIPRIQELAVKLGAVAHHIFLLVPTGRGKYIVDQEISAKEYERTLNWFYDQREKTPLQLKATCAPHYYRILRQRAKKEGKTVTFKTHGLDAVTRGCLGGTGFCFISHKGIVQPCGFLQLNCGDITKTSFADIWKNSEIFKLLRDANNLKGKCGKCEFKKVCGGCRARAYEATKDFLAEEPLCNYQPVSS
ncbi:MAG: heme b synthase [Desulfobacterales bacterium]|uniref:Heme b synthase n=1 Tax=Candidatus Desulfaltia bathyphila TaxID=2841697 RepID=A0A8J6N6H6_9BACT|nr:heme b synthase [Candidatus Desulfaltia bathyphila]MBL7195702.1 heme b synthase [Desulfobacterales bacterium]MBL7207731.1 heme b synthase [Desulfobacterales bacterium]